MRIGGASRQPHPLSLSMARTSVAAECRWPRLAALSELWGNDRAAPRLRSGAGYLPITATSVTGAGTSSPGYP